MLTDQGSTIQECRDKVSLIPDLAVLLNFPDTGPRVCPHKSTTDPEEVISLRLKDQSDKRIDTIHIHQDGISQRRK